MVHREDVTEAKQADQQRGAIAQSDKLFTQVTPEHAGQPVDLSRLARDAA